MQPPPITIQNLILKWLSTQSNPVRHDKMREVCRAVAGVVSEKIESEEENGPKYVLDEYFYPLVRAGYVEYGLNEKNEPHWQLSCPAVFYRDFGDSRHWIGINMTKKQNAQSEALEWHDKMDSDMQVHSCVTKWKTKNEWRGNGLPIVVNPPVEHILKCFPQCHPNFLGNKENVDITKYECYWTGQWRKNPNNGCNGLYKRTEEVYAQRAYYHNGVTYLLSKEPDVNFWARIMSVVDKKGQVGVYDSATKSISFNIDIPFLLGRVLFFNGMFEKMDVNSRTYVNVDKKMLKELQRILCNSIAAEVKYD